MKQPVYFFPDDLSTLLEEIQTCENVHNLSVTYTKDSDGVDHVKIQFSYD